MITPALLVDREIMMNNLFQMQEKVSRSNNVKLRPHIKTHKNPKLAEIQAELGKSGITCAKLSEAQVMAKGGIKNIFLAYPLIDKVKINQAILLAKEVDRFIFSIDTFEGAKLLSECGLAYNTQLEARIEIDTGLFRTGFSLEEIEEEVALLAKLKGIFITGIYTYRGSKNILGQTMENSFEAGVEEAKLMVGLAEKLRKKGLKVEEISVGSTPTLEGVLSVEGITEVRPGTYIFNDAMQVAYDVCRQEDCAASVRVTVVSVHQDRAVIDGGSKSFATDVQPTTEGVTITGFGLVKNHPEIVFERMNEEHGVLKMNGDSLSIGQKLEIIPNHICSTVNLYDSYSFNDGKRLPVSARGKTQ